MESVQLQALLKTTEAISQQLARIKNDVQKQLTSADYPDVSPINYIERAIKLRELFREISEGIQAKRNLAQIQKQKIEKSKNFYEGLQYYKTTLINKIKQSQIEVDNLNQYYDLPFQVHNWVENFDQVQNRMNQELSIKHKKTQEYQDMIKIKGEKQDKRKTKINLYQRVIPDKAKKIYEQVMGAASLLDCKELQPISGIISFKLSLFHEKISKLRLDNTIAVSFSREGIEQLQITILKNDYNLYKTICSNNIIIKQPETKLIVTNLPGDKLAIGLHRREDFSNEQVFQRLIHQEPIKPVFVHPKNQAQRNINSKYIRVQWLDDSMLNGLLSPLQMINAIKQRVFSLNLRQYLIQNIKKLSFYQIPICSQHNKFQFQRLQSQLIKKSVSSATLERIKFEQYLSEVHVPEWVDSYRAKYLELQRERRKMSLGTQQNISPEIQSFITLLEQLSLNEIIQPNLNTYYRGSFTIQQNKLQYMLIVPFNYPYKPSSIKLTNWAKRKQEEKKSTNFQSNTKRVKLNLSSKTVCSKIIMLEELVNKEKFLLTGEYRAYLIIMQINLLITLLYSQGDKKV